MFRRCAGVDCDGDAATQRRINISHVMRVVGASQSVVSGCRQGEPLASVPLQQKLAVCTLLLMLRCGHMKQVLMGKVSVNISLYYIYIYIYIRRPSSKTGKHNGEDVFIKFNDNKLSNFFGLYFNYAANREINIL